jgi:hypothetical protein
VVQAEQLMEVVEEEEKTEEATPQSTEQLQRFSPGPQAPLGQRAQMKLALSGKTH